MAKTLSSRGGGGVKGRADDTCATGIAVGAAADDDDDGDNNCLKGGSESKRLLLPPLAALRPFSNKIVAALTGVTANTFPRGVAEGEPSFSSSSAKGKSRNRTVGVRARRFGAAAAAP